jgi:hypothetical protein
MAANDFTPASLTASLPHPSARDDALLMAVARGNDPGASEEIRRAASGGGYDPYTVAMRLRARGLSAVAHGAAASLAPLAAALRGARVPCAVVGRSQIEALPAAELAGGISPDGSGLLVHGRPDGPPTGVPLLFIVADLGDGERASVSARIEPRDLRARLLRATCPVADIVWATGRIRVAARQIAWRNLPGRTYSSPINLASLIEQFAGRASRAVIDTGFTGGQSPVPAARGAIEPVESADRALASAFEDYSALATLCFRAGLYPEDSGTAPTLVGAALTAVGSAPRAIALPWVRQGKSPRLRAPMWPWLAAGPGFPLLLFGAAAKRAGSGPAAGFAIFLGVSLGVCGIALAVMGLRAFAARERLEAVPPSKIRSMALGPVEIEGAVEAAAPFKTPYSKVSCAWYRFEYQERHHDTRGNEGWVTIGSGGSGDIPFRVNDGTGSVLVQPAGAEIDLEPTTTILGPDHRVEEWILEESVHCFVTGTAERRSSAGEAHPLVLARLHAVKSDPAALARYGVSPGAEISADDWDRVRSAVEREVSEELAARASDPDDVFVGAAPGVPFFIATHSRAEEAGRLNRRFWVGAGFGGLYVAAALALVFAR